MALASGMAVLVDAFRGELSKLGWIEGRNITIEYRFAEQKNERLPELAADLVRLKVDLIVAASTGPALAAKSATTTVPIVMTNVGCDSHPRLCVRRECACGALPLVAILPSANSAATAYASPGFVRPLRWYYEAVRLPGKRACQHYGFWPSLTVPPHHRVWASAGPPGSRAWSFPPLPRVSDSAVSKDRSRLSLPFILPSPYQDTVGTPKW